MQYKGKAPGERRESEGHRRRESLRTHLAYRVGEDRRMLMKLLTGLAVWMLAALGLGVIVGRAIRGYAASELPAGSQQAGSDVKPSNPRAA
jgi:hypothetical protein